MKEQGLFGDEKKKEANPTWLWMRLYREARGKNADVPRGIESGILKNMMRRCGNEQEFIDRVNLALGVNGKMKPPWPFDKGEVDIRSLDQNWQKLGDALAKKGKDDGKLDERIDIRDS